MPGLRARCFAEVRRGAAAEFIEVPLRLDTVLLDGDKEQCQCVWRGLLEGVGEKMAEVETFFFLHEPLDAGYPLSHYQQWLERKKQEATAEDEDLEAVEPPAEEPPRCRLPGPRRRCSSPTSRSPCRRRGPAPGIDPAAHAAMIAQVSALAVAPPPPMPQPSAVRAAWTRRA
ncbi:MAG: hypothetical protein IPN17_28655 [Deltaproteobacteria bacterium]|nr:hypothetical protein [Deltaproteobacteria bacterium]